MIYAVIKTGGKQYKVLEGETLEVEKLPLQVGDRVVFDEVLLVKKDKEVLVGTPKVDSATVKATIVADTLADKIRVLKYKAKSHYTRTIGHRQPLTKVKIDKIEV